MGCLEEVKHVGPGYQEAPWIIQGITDSDSGSPLPADLVALASPACEEPGGTQGRHEGTALASVDLFLGVATAGAGTGAGAEAGAGLASPGFKRCLSHPQSARIPAYSETTSCSQSAAVCLLSAISTDPAPGHASWLDSLLFQDSQRPSHSSPPHAPRKETQPHNPQAPKLCAEV